MVFYVNEFVKLSKMILLSTHFFQDIKVEIESIYINIEVEDIIVRESSNSNTYAAKSYYYC
jgi:hypothetical protein